MKEVSLGIIRGKDANGQIQSFSVNKTEDGYVITSAKLERRVIAAEGVENLLVESAAALHIENAEFIPAHGALGAKGPEVHAEQGMSQPD